MIKKYLPTEERRLTFCFDGELYVVHMDYYNSKVNKPPEKRAIKLGTIYIQDSLPDFAWKKLDSLEGVQIIWEGKRL